ncbi:MAG: hypothetical protein WCG25_07680 [bacterium]
MELSREHKNILEYEKKFIDNPDDSTFDTYVDKLAWFKGEFEHLISKESKGLTQYFQNIKDDLARIRIALDNKTPRELIKTSCVSAIARVLVANML